MDKSLSRLFRLLIVVIVLLWSSLPVGAGEPTEEIRAAINQGVEILNGTKLDDKKQRVEVINRLRKIVYPLFDFDEMAKRSLGSHWRRLQPQQQKEFVSAFTELLEKTYADKIDLYEGQTVDYVGETVDKKLCDRRHKSHGQQGRILFRRLQALPRRWEVANL